MRTFSSFSAETESLAQALNKICAYFMACIVGLSIVSFSWADQPSSATPAGSNPGAAKGERFSALASFVSTTNPTYLSENQPSKLAAATNAMNACAQANPGNDLSQGYCELIELNGEALTTSAQIKAKVPTERHPLYLWRYQHKNATIYLGGSIHILKQGLYPLPAQYQQAFDATDKLIVEVNLSGYTPQELQFKSMQYALLGDGQTLTSVLPADTYAALSQVTGEYGVPLAQMNQFKPGFVTQQLAVLGLMSAGYNPAFGIENHFTSQIGEREILELETLDFQFDLLMNQPMATQLQMVNDTLDQISEFEPLTATLVSAWFAGDDETFGSTFEAQSGDSEEVQAFMRKLMDERNAGMVDKIASYLEAGGRYFALIGAGHYVGDNNLIQLLEERGFVGQRIYSDDVITR